MHCLQYFSNSRGMESALTTKTCVHFLLSFQNLAVDFVKFSDAREALFIRRIPVTDISQSTEYFLVISTEPDLKLGQHLVEGRIVTVNAVVRFRFLQGPNWMRRDALCLGALASRNSNRELVSHFLIFRPIADAICHRLLKLTPTPA